MVTQRTWCYNCGYEGYVTEEVDAPLLFDEYGQAIEGATYKYVEAYCPKCKTLIEVDSIREENIERKRQAEREHFGLISYEELRKIPKRYGVPREAVNIILDLEGESIWEGEPLSSDESDRAKKALEDPRYFLERMDEVKDSLPRELYERVRPRIANMK